MTSAPLLAAAIVVLAVALDLLAGDPPNRAHPVAWMGGALGWGRRRLEAGSPRALLVRGALLVTAVALLAGGGGWALAHVAAGAGWGGVILEAAALKLVISLRGLLGACRAVETCLAAGDLAGAQRLAGYHLVSRPTALLNEAQVASATIESAAENLTDAFVAPLLFYLAFGLGGAYLYRAVNTADAMLGYRDGALEFFGKVPARLDDALNLVPARLAAMGIVAAAALTGECPRGAWMTMVRDHGRTASPNAGWTMAAMAGALGVALEKVGAHRVGAGPTPGLADIERGLRVTRVAAVGSALGMVGLLLMRNYSR